MSSSHYYKYLINEHCTIALKTPVQIDSLTKNVKMANNNMQYAFINISIIIAKFNISFVDFSIIIRFLQLHVALLNKFL